eukprot:scpid95017/ scgid3489/ 
MDSSAVHGPAGQGDIGSHFTADVLGTWAREHSIYQPVVKYRPKEASVAKAIHDAVKLNSPEVVTFVSKIDIFYRDVAHADRHRRTDLLKMVKMSKVDTINLAWTSLLETLSKLPSHEKMDVLDLEITSAVFSSLIDGTVVARKSSIMPAAAAAAPQPTTIVDCTAETTIRYHGGWCVVAVRRELEASRKPELTSLKPVLATFGRDILSNMSPNLQNFEKIIESETHENNATLSCEHSYAELSPTDKGNKVQRHTFAINSRALDFFKLMHSIADSEFRDILHNKGDDAMTYLKQRLSSDKHVQELFATTTGSPGHAPLLGMLVSYFSKSKHKLLIYKYRLAPCKESQALRASLRTKSHKKEEAKSNSVQDEVSCIQSLLVNNDVSGVLLRLHNLDKKEQLLVLESAKLVEIRKILSHLKLPLLSDSKASKVSRLHKHLQSDLEQGLPPALVQRLPQGGIGIYDNNLVNNAACVGVERRGDVSVLESSIRLQDLHDSINPGRV